MLDRLTSFVRIVVLAVGGLALCWPAFGQQLDLSPDIPLRSSTTYQLLGRLQDYNLLLLKENDQFLVQAFDDKMRRAWSRDIVLERKTTDLLEVINDGQHIALFYHYKYKGEVHVQVRTYDADMTLLDSTLIKQYERRPFAPTPKLYCSQNKNKVAIVNVANDSKLEIQLFDRAQDTVLLDMVYSPLEFSYRNDFFDFIVDDEGGMHLILTKDNRKPKQAFNRLEITSFSPNAQDFKQYSIDFQGRLWYELALLYDNRNRQLLGAGFASQKSGAEAHEVFYLRVAPRSNDTSVLVFTPFDPDYLTLLLGRNLDKNVGLSSVDIQQLIPRIDGGLLLVAERTRRYVRNVNTYYSMYNRAPNAVQVDYHFDEVLLFSLHPDGRVHWNEVLHKKQYSQDDDGEFSSFYLMLNRSNLRFLYNDAIQRHTTAYEYVVSPSGQLVRNSLFNTKRYRLMLRMQDAYQVSADEVIVPSEYKSRLKLLKMTFGTN